MPDSTPDFEILDGGEVAQEILQAIGYAKILQAATIVSFNLQDYSFSGHGLLSRLILRQRANGAAIKFVTTPPPGKPTQNAFQDKYRLLRALVNAGVEVFLNQRLHAKAYLFLDSAGVTTAIIGSPNLTFGAFGPTASPHDRWIEMAVHTSGTTLFSKAHDFIDNKIVLHRETEDFQIWFNRNAAAIAKVGL